MASKLRNRLLSIKYDLEGADNMDPLNEGLNIKLDRTEHNYQQNIIKNCNYILSRNNCKAILALSKYMEQQEKENGEKIKYTSI